MAWVRSLLSMNLVPCCYVFRFLSMFTIFGAGFAVRSVDRIGRLQKGRAHCHSQLIGIQRESTPAAIYQILNQCDKLFWRPTNFDEPLIFSMEV
jgi:hypothetical protein